jgi:hypothetical protein
VFFLDEIQTEKFIKGLRALQLPAAKNQKIQIPHFSLKNFKTRL